MRRAIVRVFVIGLLIAGPLAAQEEEGLNADDLPECDIMVEDLDTNAILAWRGRARQVEVMQEHISTIGDSSAAEFSASALQWAMETEMRQRARPIEPEDVPGCEHYDLLLETLDDMVDDSFKTFGYLWYINEVGSTDQFVEGGREAAGALYDDVTLWAELYEMVDPGYMGD